MATEMRALSSTEILENIPQSVFTADLDGIVLYWNRGSEEIFGYSSDEILHQSIEKVYSEEGKSKFRKNLEDLRRGKEVNEQWNCIKKDDSTVWINVFAKTLFDDDGEPAAIVASVSDISLLKNVEQELMVSQTKVEAVIKSAMDGIITLDENGRIQRFNRAATNIFGYSEREVLGKNYRVLLPENDRESRDSYFKKMFQDDKARYTGKRKELAGKRKNGAVFPMELSISKATWEDNEIFTTFVSDISERRRLEQEILRISEEERRSIGQNMHDGLGQLLTGIGLISQTLARKMDKLDKPEAREVQEIADMIKEADEQARALAHGLVHVGVEEDGLQVSLTRLCKQIKKIFNINCTHDMDYDITINNSVTSLNLYRIAQEAISNAHKHGKAKNIHISLKKENDYIVLAIENDGVPFSISEGELKDAGMGINIMKYRSKMIYGRIEFTQTEKNHTKVICRVPANHCDLDES